MAKNVNARIVQKTDSLENWQKAEGFVPMDGEFFLVKDYAFPIVIGDGETNAKELSKKPLLPIGRGEGENSLSTNASTAEGTYSVALGENTQASGYTAYAEGYNTLASNYSAHAEGHSTQATGEEAHSEGWKTEAIGNKAHTEGRKTTATGHGAHAQGNMAEASGSFSAAEGEMAIASGSNSHAEGAVFIIETVIGTVTQMLATEEGTYLYIECTEENKKHFTKGKAISIGGGLFPIGPDYYQFRVESESMDNPTGCPDGYNVAIDIEEPSEANRLIHINDEVYACVRNEAMGHASHVEGLGNIATGTASHVEGISNYTTAKGVHVEGSKNYIYQNDGHINNFSHAEGVGNIIYNHMSHAEGNNNIVHGEIAHVEGKGNTIGQGEIGGSNEGHYSHVEGINNTVTGNGTHVSGEGNTVSGARSFVTGKNNSVTNFLSFVGGEGNITGASHQAIFGKYNKKKTDALFIIGNGISDADRNNAFAITQSGDIILSKGDNYVNELSYIKRENGGGITLEAGSGSIEVSHFPAEGSNIYLNSGDGEIFLNSRAGDYNYGMGESGLRVGLGLVTLGASDSYIEKESFITLQENTLSLRTKDSDSQYSSIELATNAAGSMKLTTTHTLPDNIASQITMNDTQLLITHRESNDGYGGSININGIGIKLTTKGDSSVQGELELNDQYASVKGETIYLQAHSGLIINNIAFDTNDIQKLRDLLDSIEG